MVLQIGIRRHMWGLPSNHILGNDPQKYISINAANAVQEHLMKVYGMIQVPTST